MRTLFVSILGIAMVAFALPAMAWEADLHYGLTRWLAQKVGFPDAYAEMIARANVGADAKINDARFIVFNYACLGRHDKDAFNRVAELHFPWNGTSPASPKARTVRPDNETAMDAVRSAVEPVLSKPVDEGLRRTRLARFGHTLHALQDSWSHQGEPDIPPTCNKEYAWSHPAKRGGWFSHDADLTSRHPEDAYKAAQSTYLWMQKFVEKHSWARAAKRVPFASLDSGIWEFAKAETKAEKRVWFERHNFGPRDVTFVRNLSLPNGKLFFDTTFPLGTPRRWTIPVGIQSPPTSHTVIQFFAQFFESWIRGRTSGLVATALDTAKVSAPFNDLRRELGEREAARTLFAMWVARDHGQVEEQGHGVTSNQTRASALKQLADDPGQQIKVERFEDALNRFGEGPFLVGTVVPEKQYVAIAQFTHTPHDVIAITADQTAEGWKVTSLIWAILD